MFRWGFQPRRLYPFCAQRGLKEANGDFCEDPSATLLGFDEGRASTKAKKPTSVGKSFFQTSTIVGMS